MKRIESLNSPEVRIVKKEKKKKAPKKKFAEDGEAVDEVDSDSESKSDQSADEPKEIADAGGKEEASGEATEEQKDAGDAVVGDEGEEAKEEGEPKAKTPIEEKKQSVFDEDIGGIEINIIGDDGQVKKGKTYEHNRHKPKGTRRPGIRTNRKVYEDDQIEKGEIFLDKQEPFELTLGDPKVPIGLWRAIEHMRKGEKARIMIKAAYGYAHRETAGAVEYPEGWGEGEKRRML